MQAINNPAVRARDIKTSLPDVRGADSARESGTIESIAAQDELPAYTTLKRLQPFENDAIEAAAPEFVIAAVALRATASGAISLPADTSQLKKSDLAGYQIARQECGISHSADYVDLQSFRHRHSASPGGAGDEGADDTRRRGRCHLSVERQRVPMPPFDHLRAVDLKTLAEYVLPQ